MPVYYIPTKTKAELISALNAKLKDIDGGAEIEAAPLETITSAVSRLSGRGEGPERTRPKLAAEDAVAVFSLFLAVLASEPWGRLKKTLLKDVAELIYYSDELLSEAKLDLLDSVVNLDGNNELTKAVLLSLPLHVCLDSGLYARAAPAVRALAAFEPPPQRFAEVGPTLLFASQLAAKAPEVVENASAVHLGYVRAAVAHGEAAEGGLRGDGEFCCDLGAVCRTVVAEWLGRDGPCDGATLRLLTKAEAILERAEGAADGKKAIELLRIVAKGDFNGFFEFKMANRALLKALNADEARCREKLKFCDLGNLLHDAAFNGVVPLGRVNAQFLLGSEKLAENFVISAIDKGYIKARIDLAQNAVVLNDGFAHESFDVEKIKSGLTDIKNTLSVFLKTGAGRVDAFVQKAADAEIE